MIKRFKITDLRLKIFILIVPFIFLNLQSLIINPVHAEDASHSGTQSATLTQKLDELKKEIASKAAELKSEVNKKMQNKAFIGQIISINDKGMELLTRNGSKKVSINEYTAFDSKIKTAKKTKPSMKDFSTGDFAAALGDVDDKGVLVSKKLVKVDKIATEEAKLVIGTIDSRQSYTINLKSQDKILNVLTSANTDFLLGEEKASISDATKGELTVAKGIIDGDNFKAEFVYFVELLQDKKVSTSSATPSTKKTDQ